MGGLVALVLGLTAICSHAAEASKPKHLIRSTIRAVDCAGPICIGGGCCPEPSWVCCPHGKYCAINLDACPKYDMVAKVQRLIRTAAGPSKVGVGHNCDGKQCPGGCCHDHYDWFCCENPLFCAEVEEDCPPVRDRTRDIHVYITQLVPVYRLGEYRSIMPKMSINTSYMFYFALHPNIRQCNICVLFK